jgi:hypothetical protein
VPLDNKSVDRDHLDRIRRRGWYLIGIGVAYGANDRVGIDVEEGSETFSERMELSGFIGHREVPSNGGRSLAFYPAEQEA